MENKALDHKKEIEVNRKKILKYILRGIASKHTKNLIALII